MKGRIGKWILRNFSGLSSNEKIREEGQKREKAKGQETEKGENNREKKGYNNKISCFGFFSEEMKELDNVDLETLDVDVESLYVEVCEDEEDVENKEKQTQKENNENNNKSSISLSAGIDTSPSIFSSSFSFFSSSSSSPSSLSHFYIPVLFNYAQLQRNLFLLFRSSLHFICFSKYGADVVEKV
jgi:hypothetical protein